MVVTGCGLLAPGRNVSPSRRAERLPPLGSDQDPPPRRYQPDQARHPPPSYGVPSNTMCGSVTVHAEMDTLQMTTAKRNERLKLKAQDQSEWQWSKVPRQTIALMRAW
jgi:hypothetical protein